MAAELKRSKGLVAELIPGSQGIFDVALDGKIIYSKKITGRFPKSGEVTALIGNVAPV